MNDLIRNALQARQEARSGTIARILAKGRGSTPGGTVENRRTYPMKIVKVAKSDE